MKLVLAGSHQQFLSWLAEGGRPPGEYRPVQHDTALHAVSALHVEELHLVGTYWESPVWGGEAYAALMRDGLRAGKSWAADWNTDWRRAEAAQQSLRMTEPVTEAEVADARARQAALEARLNS